MRFVRYHGKVIPIHEKPGRADAAGTSALSAAGAAGTVAGLSKLGSVSATKEQRLTKIARKSTAQGEKAAHVLEYAMKEKKATPKFTASTVERIQRNTARGEKLLGKAAMHGLAKTALRRTAVVAGGLAIGHTITTASHAITGKEPGLEAKGASHLLGISLAAIASAALFRGVPQKAAKVKKILSMAGKVRKP